MFVFNLKFIKSKAFKIVTLILIFIAISFFIVSIYKFSKQLLKKDNKVTISDTIENDIAIIDPKNYTNILKEVHENLNEYIGQKISFTGYVYRVFDIKENEFILARNMIINSNNQTLVVGFLCDYDNSMQIPDNTWVSITGTIQKGDYYGEIPCIKVEKLDIVDKPENEMVYPPDETYIPTSVIY